MQLIFNGSITSAITLSEITLSLHIAEEFTECRLVWQSNLEQYQHFDRNALFNLKPELRNSQTSSNFLPDLPIEIEAILQPDLLIHLQDSPTPEAAIAVLQTLNSTQLDHPLFQTENWYILSVKQQQATGEIGYRTFWSYLNLTQLSQADLFSEAIATGMINFFQDCASQVFSQDRIAATLDDWIESLSEIAEDLSPSLYATMIDFFTEEDWSFTKLQGETTLQMRFQGHTAQWTCYARVRDAQQQFLFYSVCPIAVSLDQRSAIAHFLTRANYGMTLGNFELDFEDGEIRYKTSIDVTGDRLTSALIKNLVYTNVAMMDAYLPGIQAVIEGTAPEAAIQAIEAA